jgi:hypothetical protein
MPWDHEIRAKIYSKWIEPLDWQCGEATYYREEADKQVSLPSLKCIDL